MIKWTPYPNVYRGEYANYRGLVLIANHNGAWSVYDPLGPLGAFASELAPSIYAKEELNIESAKAKAEAAAIKMLS